MLFLDYNSSIRDIFKQVEGVSQHGLDELFDEEVIAGNKSYSEAVISAGLASREDILGLVAEYLGYELQVGEVDEIDSEVISSIQPELIPGRPATSRWRTPRTDRDYAPSARCVAPL